MRSERKPIVILVANDNKEDHMMACDAPAGASIL